MSVSRTKSCSTLHPAASCSEDNSYIQMYELSSLQLAAGCNVEVPSCDDCPASV